MRNFIKYERSVIIMTLLQLDYLNYSLNNYTMTLSTEILRLAGRGSVACVVKLLPRKAGAASEIEPGRGQHRMTAIGE